MVASTKQWTHANKPSDHQPFSALRKMRDGGWEGFAANGGRGGEGKGGGDFRPIARTLPLTLCEEERKISLCYKLLLLKEKLLAFLVL